MSNNIRISFLFLLIWGHGRSLVYLLSVASYLHLFESDNLDPDGDTTNKDFNNSDSAESQQNTNDNENILNMMIRGPLVMY